MSTPSDSERWIHPVFEPLDIETNGPFVAMPDGGLLTLDAEALTTSEDDGGTWSDPRPASFGQHPREPASYYLLRARSGVLVLVYLDLVNCTFSWDDEAGEPKPECRLELCSVRSLDDGRTWVDRQTLLHGYNANFFGFIQTRSGRLVVVAEHLVTQPGHWVACSLVSDDEGATWQSSNFIDIGGHGHHDGATEPTVAELSDGRLLMLIRTNLDRFWQATSDDGGRYWRTLEPSTIDASSAPGALLRLQSGRLLLVWNRLNPDGRVWEKTPGGQLSEYPASWHREELSYAFSEDDGATWTVPVVIARQPGGQLSYPYTFERRPGELWVFAGFARKKGWEDPLPLRLRVREAELVQEAGRVGA